MAKIGRLLFLGLRARSLSAEIFSEWFVVDVKLLERRIAIAHTYGHVSVLFAAPAVFAIGRFRGRRTFFRDPVGIEWKPNLLRVLRQIPTSRFDDVITFQLRRADAINLSKSIGVFLQDNVNRITRLDLVRFRRRRSRKRFGRESQSNISPANRVFGINRRSLKFPNPTMGQSLDSSPHQHRGHG
jgi:hypothetical protein